MNSTWETLVKQCIDVKIAFIIGVHKFVPISDHELKLFRDLKSVEIALNEYLNSDICDNPLDVATELMDLENTYLFYFDHTWAIWSESLN